MPPYDQLMEQWPPALEQTLRDVEFPGPEIAMSTEEYAKLICAMLNIPVHKVSNNKGLVEAVYTLFETYSGFKETMVRPQT